MNKERGECKEGEGRMNKEGRGIMEKEEGTMDNEGEGRE